MKHVIDGIELPAFPWAWNQQGDANDHVLLTSGGQWVIAFRTNGEFMPAKEEAVIRHLVASANACAGVSAEDFKSGAVMVCGSNQVAYFDKVLQQRDELLVEFAAYKEGSEEAFGTVVAQKQAAEARLKSMQTTIDSQQGVICTILDQRNELLAALEQFLDQEGGPPQDTGEWREVLRVIASVKGGAA